MSVSDALSTQSFKFYCKTSSPRKRTREAHRNIFLLKRLIRVEFVWNVVLCQSFRVQKLIKPRESQRKRKQSPFQFNFYMNHSSLFYHNQAIIIKSFLFNGFKNTRTSRDSYGAHEKCTTSDSNYSFLV